jgi:hypothetical protein
MKKKLWANYINNAQDVPMTYVHFIIILITVPERIESIKFVETFVSYRNDQQAATV